MRQQGAKRHAEGALNVQVEAAVLVQVDVAEEIRPVRRALQHVPQVLAVLAGMVKQSLPDSLIIAEGASQLRHVAVAHHGRLLLCVVHICLHDTRGEGLLELR